MADSSLDAHPADVMADLRKTEKRWSLRALSLAHGYSPSAVGVALRKPWPAVEAIVASELGKAPQEIWPTRYDQNGLPRRATRPGRISRRAGTRSGR